MRHWLLVSLDSPPHSRLAGCALRGGCVLAPQPDFEDARGGGGGIGTKAAAEAAAAAGGGGGAMTLVAGQLRRAAADGASGCTMDCGASWRDHTARALGRARLCVRLGCNLVRDPWPPLTSALGLQSMGEGSKHDQGGDGDGDGFDGGGDGFDGGGGDMLADGGDGFEGSAASGEQMVANGHADSAAAVTDSLSDGVTGAPSSLLLQEASAEFCTGDPETEAGGLEAGEGGGLGGASGGGSANGGASPGPTCVSTNAMAIRGGSSHATAALAAYGRRLLRMSAISGTDGELLSSPARRQTALLTALGDARAAGLRWSILRRTAFPSYTSLAYGPRSTLLWPSQPADPASIGHDCSGGDGSAMTSERIRPFQSSPLALVSTTAARDAPTRRYVLRELNAWLVDDRGRNVLLRGMAGGERGGGGGVSGWLGYDVGEGECALYRQRRSLRSALMMAIVLRRSLVLPRFCSHAQGPASRTVPFSFLFDYGAFAAAFPEHIEAGAFRSSGPACAADELRYATRVHIALADAPQAHKKEMYLNASFRSRSPKGASEAEVKKWLVEKRKFKSQPLLW